MVAILFAFIGVSLIIFNIFALFTPPLVPAIMDQRIILNLGSCSALPLFVTENAKRLFGIIHGIDKIGKDELNTVWSHLLLDIKNSFSFIFDLVGR